MRLLFGLIIYCVIISGVNAQDKSYNTDDLKKMKRITADEWKRLKEDAGAKAQRYSSANASDVSLQATKGRIVIKANQTVDLKNETDVTFDYLFSAGQDAKGNPAVKNRHSFKIGPGKYEIKDGLIRRVE